MSILSSLGAIPRNPSEMGTGTNFGADRNFSCFDLGQNGCKVCAFFG